MSISNFFKKFVMWINNYIKYMANFMKKVILVLVVGIIIGILLSLLFVDSNVPVKVSHAKCTEISGKLNITLEEEHVVKDPYFPPRIVVWSWNGGSTIKKEQLESTIFAVLLKLPMTTADETMIELLQETAAIESRRGIYIAQLNGGPARGIFQMELRTIKYRGCRN